MNYLTPVPRRRNIKAFIAAFISYVMLAGQVAPLAAHAPMPPNVSQSSSEAATPAPAVNRAAPVAQPLFAAPVITATKVDAFPSHPSGKANPGDIIDYTVTITNTGDADATGVQFSDSVDANTTLVPGSVQTQPIAAPDNYNVIGNVRIQPNAAAGLLANDCDPDNGPGCSSTGLTASGPSTTTQGGNITINADGSFSYNPAPGFTGTDTVTYTVTDASGKTDTAVATFTVGNGTATPGTNVIWFVNSAAATNGDGRLTSPFNCLRGPLCFDSTTTGGAADDPGDTIFLFASATSYNGGLTLLNNQLLIGQGASGTLAADAGYTVPPNSDALPVLNSNPASTTITTTVASTNGINIGAGSSNNLRGFTVGNTTGAKIASAASPPAAAFGTLTVSEVILNGTGQALNLDNGTLAATFASITSTSSGTQGISLEQIAGSLTSTNGTTISGNTTQCILVTASTAAMSFGNTSCTGGTDGVSLQNNTNTNTRSFGTLSVSGGSGNAFLHSNGGGNTTISGAASLASGNDPIEIANAANGTSINFAGSATVTKTTTGGEGVHWSGTNTGATLTFNTLALTTSNGTGVNLSGGGTVNVTNGAGSSISATGTGTQAAPAINASSVALGMNFTTVSATGGGSGTGQGITLTTVTGSLTVNNGASTATNIQNTGGAGINVTSSSATLNFGNTVVNASGGTGVILGGSGAGNSGAITFGAFTSTPDSGQRGILAQQNTGALTTTSGTITTTNNTAVEIAGTSAASRTPLNIQLTTVNTTGGATAANGIALTNTSATGSPGGFRVLGNGGTCTFSTPTCTGGRITNTAGAEDATPEDNGGVGVRLNNATQVFLTRMRIDNHPNFAIAGLSVVGFNLDTSVIDGTNGTNAAFDEGAIQFRELTGTTGAGTASNITNCFIGGGFEFLIDVRNFNGGTLDRLTVSNNTIGDLDGAGPGFGVSAAAGDDALHFEGFGSGAVFKVTANGNTLNSGRGDVVNFNVGNTGTITSDFVFRNNSVFNTHPAILSGGGGVTVTMGGGATVTSTYDISCNFFRGAKGFGLLVAKTLGGGTAQGTIFNNHFGTLGVAGSASSEASGLDVDTRGAGTHTVLIKNNTVNNWFGNGAIQLFNNQGSATMNATVIGNASHQGNATNALAGLYTEVGALAGDTSVMNVLVGGAGGARNDFTDGDPANANDVLLSRIAGGGTTYNLSRGVSVSNSPAQIITDNNITPVTTGVAGTITPVNTSPALPPAIDETCTPPAGLPDTITPDNTTDGPGNGSVIGAPADSAPTQQAETGVTSRPFVSPVARPVSPKTVAVAPTTTVARGTTPATKSAGASAQDGVNRKGIRTPISTSGPGDPNGAGGTVSVSIGTLRPGDSVTITFQVMIDNPYSGPANVSNQGTVSGSNFSNVLTDDPAVAGAANSTLTPVDSLNIFARDAKVGEPVTGTTTLLFTVALSSPAAGTVSVNFATADGGATPATGGATCGTAGVDYQSTSGTVSFAAGEQVKTVPVTVCSDAVSEPDETLLLNLSGAVGGNILDAQAVGTITVNTAGTFLISELRTSGPGGLGDDFVELYNNTTSPLTVAASDASAGFGLYKMGTNCNAVPVLIATIPNGTVIPARGHFLAVGSQYSLGAYATGNVTLTSDIESDRDVAVFSTADIANISTATRLDAVGFDGNTGGGVCDLLREGTTLPPVSGSTTQYSFFRKECDFQAGVGCTTQGTPKDTNDNSQDFSFADTQGTFISGVQQRLGAPGPQNLASPIKRDPGVAGTLLDNSKVSSVSPNRVRDLTSNPGNNSTFGTLSIRRRFQNNTGANVTRLRFRIVDITTFPSPGGGVADLRPITSANVTVSGVTDAGTCQAATGSPATPCTITVKGTTLEQPPAQPNGGGFNSSMADGTITVGTPLAPGASANLQFVLGVQTTGTFRFLFIIEALP